jgi:hypothetical protein
MLLNPPVLLEVPDSAPRVVISLSLNYKGFSTAGMTGIFLRAYERSSRYAHISTVLLTAPS